MSSTPQVRKRPSWGSAIPDEQHTAGQQEAELGFDDPTDQTRRADGLGQVLQQAGIAESAHWDRRAPARPGSLMSEDRGEGRGKIACPQRFSIGQQEAELGLGDPR